VVDQGQAAIKQERYCLLYEPGVGLEGIEETYPRAIPLKLREDIKKESDLKYNERVTVALDTISRTRARIKIISQCLLRSRPLGYTLRHPEEVIQAALWLVNEVSEREGRLGPVQEGFVRRIKRPTADGVLDRHTRVIPAPLKVFRRNVFTGITPANLRSYAHRKLPRIQRTETEVQAPWEEAYPDGAVDK
jgi:hypothetical protein